MVTNRLIQVAENDARALLDFDADDVLAGSPRFGNVKNNDPGLIEPISTAG